jgi:hypothetical protein
LPVLVPTMIELFRWRRSARRQERCPGRIVWLMPISTLSRERDRRFRKNELARVTGFGEGRHF